MLEYDRRLIVHALYGGDTAPYGEIVRLVAWFLIPPPFGAKAFSAVIAPVRPWSIEAIAEAHARYTYLGSDAFAWTRTASNPIYREANSAADTWKLFMRFLHQTWSTFIDSKGLTIVPATSNEEQIEILLKQLHTAFTKTTHNAAILKEFQWPFSINKRTINNEPI